MPQIAKWHPTINSDTDVKFNLIPGTHWDNKMVQYLQISDNESSNDNFASKTLIY